jgi:hypothetical protein
MDMNSTAKRIVRRYLYGDGFINLPPIPVVLADGGVVSAADLERLLRVHGIEAHDVVLYRHDDGDINLFRWAGRGRGQEVVRGQLVLHVAHDRRHVVVSAEIALAARYTAAQVEEQDAQATAPMMPVKQRLQLIAATARLVIEALRADPESMAVILTRLTDIVEIAEGQGWAVEP